MNEIGIMSDDMNSRPPSGLPDEATLTRLASELFTAGYSEFPKEIEPNSTLPGRTSDPSATQPPSAAVSSSSAPEPTMSAATTAMPDITPGSLPDNTSTLSSLPPPADLTPMITDSFATTLLPHSTAGVASSVGSRAPSGAPVPWNVLPAAQTVPPEYYFIAPSEEHESTASPTTPAEAVPPWDVNAVRRDFPILSQSVHGHRLVWMDNAATTQKPQPVIDRISHFYTYENSNIHRGAHELAMRATDAFESARDTVARFLGAGSSDEVVFVRGTTEAINLIAQSWGRKNVGAGDEIIITHLEHHSNIVPWQQLTAEKGATLRVIPVDDNGQILLDEYGRMLHDRTRLVAISHVSNALGTITPIRQVVDMAHSVGARVLVDGAQAVAHLPVDMAELGPDFYVFSGHKIFGPTGIGVLYGRSTVLDTMPPWQGGGNMITHVALDQSEFQSPPARFEAGTGSIADAVGLGAALDYVQRIGLPNIARYEHDLIDYATKAMQAIPGLRLIGTAPDKASVLSFVLAGYHPAEVGSALNREGIAVRAGHHCAQPILRHYGLEATVRPSLAFYNTYEEVDLLVATLRRLATFTGHRSV